MWRSLVARLVRDEEVVGSNPAIPTTGRPVSLLARGTGRSLSRIDGARSAFSRTCRYFRGNRALVRQERDQPAGGVDFGLFGF
jgi:hypothetical protein